MKESIKAKVIQAVNSYKENFPEDYQAVKKYIKQKRENLIKDSGDMTHMSDFIERPLFEVPEELHEMILNTLDKDEYKEFYQNKEKEGVRWFARTFKEFSLVKKI